MTEQTIIRLAMVLQNQAPSTLDKYICKLSEAILFEYHEGLNIAGLSRAIDEQFSLSFAYTEIAQAIERKGNKRIIVNNDIYHLEAKVRNSMASLHTVEDQLQNYVVDFISQFDIHSSPIEISTLLTRYLYFCFNSNVNNLLTLLNHEMLTNSQVFEATNEEISIINQFISWDNEGKNSFIYSIVSTCYEYCMLTVKKDNILSKELFKGKRFYMDANIIFRMAGINNEERQFVTHDFIKRCQEANIELLCTSSTIDEIYRVISSQVDMIRGIANSSMPVNCELLDKLNPSFEITDFYRIYYEWCNNPGNKHGDYNSFQQYLLSLVHRSLSSIKVKQSTPFLLGSSSKIFQENVKKLQDYKATRKKWRSASYASAETDVTNILDIIEGRNSAGGNSLFQTNGFIISADQLLISWASSVFPGVPIVVLPSVWLSIMLKFTGRSDDDYRSFCLFLTQRQHVSQNDNINPVELLKNINLKTANTEVKEHIISEILQNKTAYPFMDENAYEDSVDRAFDKVMEEYYGKTALEISNIKAEMEDQLRTLAKSSQQYADERAELRAEGEKDKTIVILSKKQANDKVRPFKALARAHWLFYLLGGIIVIGAVLIWSFEIQPLYGWFLALVPQKIRNNPDKFSDIWAVITVGIGLVIGAIGKLFSNLGSDEREQQLYKKYYEKNQLSVHKSNL